MRTKCSSASVLFYDDKSNRARKRRRRQVLNRRRTRAEKKSALASIKEKTFRSKAVDHVYGKPIRHFNAHKSDRDLNTMNSPHRPAAMLSIDDGEAYFQNLPEICIREQPQRKSVGFHPNVLVHEELHFSKSDRRGMHYTRHEIKSFSKEVRQYETAGEGSDTATINQNICLTGLEALINPIHIDHKRRHKLQAVLTVLMEQDRQYIEMGYYIPIDVESMSKLYHHVTLESRAEAHERALQCEKMKTYDAYAPKANTPMPKAA